MSKHAPIKIRIGCAGWSLSSKVADSFPAAGSHLERYSAVFSAVEINSSFYRPHMPKTYARWRDSVPKDFSFAVKMPRTISHEHRLRDTNDLLDRFLAEASELENKLGCLLLQLPPSLEFNVDEADAFFSLLRRQTKIAVACEPRHGTWFTNAATDLMRQYAIGCVDADPRPVPNSEPSGFDRTVYLRLHGSPVIYRSAYDDAFIEGVSEQIDTTAPHADAVWCIFDNTADGEAIPNALALQRRLR
jgi:uncharacterized protein YecE (DUF72 family)